MAEKIHRVVMGLLVIASVGLMHMGYFFEGSIVLTIVGAALIIWGLTGFCTMLKILKKIFPKECESCK